jgi:hypothetical protein|tara:strand:- start:16 stop:432 length:417 start_codon:yes stop_codon:yes gene_type:complete
MKLLIDKNLNIPEEKCKTIAQFCLYCANMLPIEGEFKVYVVSEREPYSISTTAVYMTNKNCCYIYGKNRAIPDIMRSIAHEMTHMMQDQTGLIRGQIRDAGGFHEDQANARAGELLKRFVREDSSRKSIYESKFKSLH